MKSRASANSSQDEFWAITAYFNPGGYRRRLANFKTFRQHLNVPLVAVELAYGPEFELQEGDAEILIQRRGGAVLWQKERLLNLALQALPAACRKVAWLDCDIIFGKSDWYESARSLLDSVPIVQLFREAHYLPQHWTPYSAETIAPELTRRSAAYGLALGTPPAAAFGSEFDHTSFNAAGLAWAARREALDRHGFFDAAVVGGGDSEMLYAANKRFEELMQRHKMGERQRERYLAWARPYCETMGATTRYVDTELLHLWHGKLSDRALGPRHAGLSSFGFDPFTDIAGDENGLWRWNTNKPQMHEYVRNYLMSRKEDG